MPYTLSINDLTEENIENNLIFEIYDKSKPYPAVNYKYPDGKIKPFSIYIENLTLPNNCIPSYASDYMPGEYCSQRFMFKMKISKNDHIFKILNKIDEMLMEFGSKEENNALFKKKQLYAGICKKPTLEKAEKYKESHKEEKREAEEILNDNDKLNCYAQFKYKLPITNDNKTIKIFNKDTAITNLKIEKKEENIDFDIEQPYTLDFLNELTKKGNNIDIIVNIGSWYSMAANTTVKYYGYKAFINKIILNSISDDNGDDTICFKGNNAFVIKSNKKLNVIKKDEVKDEIKNEKEDENDVSDDNEEQPEVDENVSEEEEEKPKQKTQSKVKKTTKKQTKKTEKEDTDIEDD